LHCRVAAASGAGSTPNGNSTAPRRSPRRLSDRRLASSCTERVHP
jgi:hypothetical protein